MKFAVDKIIDNVAVLEDLTSGAVKHVDVSYLPSNTKEKDILIFDNNTYVLDINEKEKRINMLREKMNRLRGDNDGN